jgi:murein DD-endopeptidase MepM/ murein hydrolase activator NlpD
VIKLTVNRNELLSWFLWALALIAVLGAGYLIWQGSSPQQAQAFSQPLMSQGQSQPVVSVNFQIPDFHLVADQGSIHRIAELNTIIPERENINPIIYTVEANDSLFGLAEKFSLEPESILWSNYDLLKDNPHSLRPGMELLIPPVDGILYKWEEGDTVESVAADLKTEPEKITSWIGNDLDLTDPEIQPGELVMVPDGQREFQQWIIPTIARGAAGVSAGIYGEGACVGPFEGLYGGGGFIWPAAAHSISGNDYWSGHLAIDITATQGEPIWAADSGVVVFAGWSTGGYGNVVVIDHGTGYQTLYAHLSTVSVGCGQSVVQGQTIGLAGSTGNSTGAHLHFEVRFQGGFVNPWFVLPPP